MAVDATELLAGLIIPVAHQRSAICPILPVFDVAGMVPTEFDHALDAVRGPQRAARVGGTPRRSRVSVPSRPSRSEAGRAGVGALQLASQGL